MSEDPLLDFFTPKPQADKAPAGDDPLLDFFTPKQVLPPKSPMEAQYEQRLMGRSTQPDAFLPPEQSNRDQQLAGLQRVAEMSPDKGAALREYGKIASQPLSADEGQAAMERYRKTAIERGTDNAGYIAERLPLVGLAKTGLEASARIGASKRIEAGKGVENDYRIIGEMMAEGAIAQNRTEGLSGAERFGVKVADVGTQLPAMIAEWMMSGPGGAIGRNAATQAAKAAVTKLAERSAGRMGLMAAEGAAKSTVGQLGKRAVGVAGETVGRTLAPVGLAQIGANAADRASRGESTGEAIKNAAIAKVIDNAANVTFGRPGTIPGILGAEVSAEGQYRAGVAPRGSTVTRMLHGDKEALEDFAAMALVFGGAHGVTKAIEAGAKKRAEQVKGGLDPNHPKNQAEVAKVVEAEIPKVEEQKQTNTQDPLSTAPEKAQKAPVDIPATGIPERASRAAEIAGREGNVIAADELKPETTPWHEGYAEGRLPKPAPAFERLPADMKTILDMLDAGKTLEQVGKFRGMKPAPFRQMFEARLDEQYGITPEKYLEQYRAWKGGGDEAVKRVREEAAANREAIRKMDEALRPKEQKSSSTLFMDKTGASDNPLPIDANMLAGLSAKQREILAARWAGESFDAVAAKYGDSRQNIQKMEKRILKRVGATVKSIHELREAQKYNAVSDRIDQISKAMGIEPGSPAEAAGVPLREPKGEAGAKRSKTTPGMTIDRLTAVTDKIIDKLGESKSPQQDMEVLKALHEVIESLETKRPLDFPEELKDAINEYIGIGKRGGRSEQSLKRQIEGDYRDALESRRQRRETGDAEAAGRSRDAETPARPAQRTLFDDVEGSPELLYQGRTHRQEIKSSPRATSDASKQGPYNLKADADYLYGKAHVRKLPNQAAEESYQQHIDFLAISGRNAGNIPIRIHGEHHRLATHEAEADFKLASLTPEQIRGYQSFDYAKTPRRNVQDAVLEGFSEYAREYVDDGPRLNRLTADERAAVAHAQGVLKKHGWDKKNDRMREGLRQYKALSVEDRVAGIISGTGQPAKATGLTATEQVDAYLADLKQAAVDNWVDRLAPLARLQEAAAKKKGYVAPRPGEDIRTIASQMHFAAEPLADRAAYEGIIDYRKDANGDFREYTISKPITHLGETVPADKRGIGGWLSSYIMSRSVVGEIERGGQMVQGVDPVAQKRGVTKLMTAAPWQIAEMKEFLDKAKADPALYAKAEEAFYRTVEYLQKLQEPLVHTGFLSQKAVDAMRNDKPEYIPHFRVMDDKAAQASLLFSREGSGRQFVDPFVSTRKLVDITYGIVGKQMIDRAFWDAMSVTDGRRGIPGQAKEIEVDRTPLSATQELQAREAMEAIGYPDVLIDQIIKDMGADALAFNKKSPWNPNGTNTYPMRIDGAPKKVEILNERLWNHLNGDMAPTLKAVMDKNVMQALAKTVSVQKFGATSARIAFSPLNAVRDFPFFLRKAVAEGASWPKAVGAFFSSMPEVTYNKIRKVLGMEYTDFYKLYDDIVGGEKVRAYGGLVARGEGSQAWKELHGRDKGFTGGAVKVANKLLDVVELYGSTEHMPRLASFKLALERMGYTRKDIEASLQANPNKSPIPLHVWMYAGQMAREGGPDFSKQGAVVSEINKVAPFFGAHITGWNQDVALLNRGIADMRKGRLTSGAAQAAYFAIGATLVLEAIHYMTFKDKEWYDRLPAHLRHRWFILGVDENGAPWGVPKPHGPILVLGALAQEAIRDMVGGKGRWDLAAKSVVQEAIPDPRPSGFKEMQQVDRNEDWSGRDIVPNDGRGMSDSQKLFDYQLPYVFDQLTGGMFKESNLRLPHQAFRAGTTDPAQPVQDLYDTYHDLDVARTQSPERKKGGVFKDEKLYKIADAARLQITKLNTELAGKRYQGSRIVEGTPPTPERIREIRRKKIEIAEKALKELQNGSR